LAPDALAKMVVLLDLKGVTRPGERTFPIDSVSVPRPAGVDLERAVPSQIRMTFERRLSREVPVSIRFVASPPAGFEVVNQKVEPAAVRIAGPDSRVREIVSVETDPIDLSDTQGTEEFQAQLYVGDPRVHLETEGKARVRIEVRAKQRTPGTQ